VPLILIECTGLYFDFIFTCTNLSCLPPPHSTLTTVHGLCTPCKKSLALRISSLCTVLFFAFTVYCLYVCFSQFFFIACSYFLEVASVRDGCCCCHHCCHFCQHHHFLLKSVVQNEHLFGEEQDSWCTRVD